MLHNSQNKFKKAVILSGAVFISACGGGGGSAPQTDTLGQQAVDSEAVIASASHELSIENLQVNESAKTAVITIRMNKPSNREVRVNYTTEPGTAKPGQHYTAASGAAIIDAGNTEVTLTVSVIDDNQVNEDRRFVVSLLKPAINARIEKDRATVTIKDNDTVATAPPVLPPPGPYTPTTPIAGNGKQVNPVIPGGGGLPTLSLYPATISEDQGVVRAIATLSQKSSQPVELFYASKPGTAEPGRDFHGANKSIIFAPGETAKPIEIRLIDDKVPEKIETFDLTITHAKNAGIATKRVQMTIVDDDTPITPVNALVSGVNVNESDGTAEVKVNLDKPSKGIVVIQYLTVPLTAQAGADYDFSFYQVIFNPGETQKTVAIKIHDDSLVEQDEKLKVWFKEGKHVKLINEEAIITIADNDKAPLSLSIADIEADESDIAQVLVTLSESTDKAVKVTYATKPGTALPGKDYRGKVGKLIFLPGDTEQVVHIDTFDNDDFGDKTFTFKVTSASNVPAPDGQTTITIRDNDSHVNQQPTVSITAPNEDAHFKKGDTIGLAISAQDPDGTINKVSIYQKGKLLGRDAAAPYRFTLQANNYGRHTLTVVATDTEGAHTVEHLHYEVRRASTGGGTTNPPTQPPAPSTPPVTGNPQPATGDLVTYPATGGVRNHKSGKFAVTLKQKNQIVDSFVYTSVNNAKPGWSGTLNYMQKANHWTTFSFAGEVDVTARRLDGKAIQTCIVRPLSLGVQPRIAGDKCVFRLNRQARVSVEIDERKQVSRFLKHTGNVTKNIVQHPLFVFANPLETDIPKAGDPGVLYYGPGVHNIGKKKLLNNNTQVYIAGGAYVIGNFRARQKDPQNISIRGRGILTGKGLTETADEHNQWGNHTIDFTLGKKGRNLLIEGITIADPLRSCIVSYNSVDIRNVKLFSWSHRNDGITAGQGSIIEDSFIKVTDDNMKLYYSNQTIRNNVVWQQTAGAVFKFAWKLAGTSQGHKISDIDIIHSDVFDDFSGSEPDRPDMRSTSAIFSAMAFRKNATFKNAVFKNIRIEEKQLFRLMGLRMVTSHRAPNDAKKVIVWGDANPNAKKTIEGLRFENMTLASVPYKQATLYGNKGGQIRDFLFKGLKVNGRYITSASDLSSKSDGVGLLTAGQVSNIRFER
ncbi:MAG: Calx-beta domain-containing protein [Gammaproteobacteria bacterium]